MKPNKCFVFAISLSLMLNIAFAFIEILDCTLSDPSDPFSFARVSDAQWGTDADGVPSVALTLTGPFPIQAIAEFIIDGLPDRPKPPEPYFMSHSVLRWVNGYHDYMFDPNGPNTTYVGTNPHTVHKTISNRNFPPPGTWVEIFAKAYFGCHRDNEDVELKCKFCASPIRRQVP